MNLYFLKGLLGLVGLVIGGIALPIFFVLGYII